MMARERVTFVVGGGDVACEEALYLTQFASHVYQVLRRDQFRATQAMVDRVLSNKKITVVYDSGVEEIQGDKRITHVVLKNFKTNESTKMEAGALFWAIGHKPMTDLVNGQVDMKNGYVLVKGATQQTSVAGFFAAGDCCDAEYRQAVVAAGSGCKAALDAERYLGSIKK